MPLCRAFQDYCQSIATSTFSWRVAFRLFSCNAWAPFVAKCSASSRTLSAYCSSQTSKRSGESSSRKTVILLRNIGIYNRFNRSIATSTVNLSLEVPASQILWKWKFSARLAVSETIGCQAIPRSFMCPAKLLGSIFLAEMCAWLFDTAWYDFTE